MPRLSRAMTSLVLASASFTSASAGAAPVSNPMGFFEGRTDSLSTIKLVMRRPYDSRAIGFGRIKKDGSLELVQRVEQDGEPTKIRRWDIHQTGPGLFTGTMNEAVGPVTIEEVGGRFRFRFKMNGHLSVEEWLTPKEGGQAAASSLTVRKFGIKVGSSNGYIRKVK